MRVQRGGSALDRMKAATETKTGQGQLMVQPTPDEAAAAIYDCSGPTGNDSLNELSIRVLLQVINVKTGKRIMR